MDDGTIATDWTSTKVRVRYAETDQMGVVYYANYFVWFEIGRTDFCAQHGFAYRAMERDDEAIASWVKHDWPRVKKTPGAARPGSASKTNRASASSPR